MIKYNLGTINVQSVFKLLKVGHIKKPINKTRLNKIV